MIALPDEEAFDWYARIKAALAAEWALIEASEDKALIVAHAELHYLLKDAADALEINPPEPRAGEPKPPRPH